MRIPAAAAGALRLPATARSLRRPAYPLLTIDDDGFPHVCMLAAEQLDLHEGDYRLGISVAGRRSQRFLQSRGRATLVVVSGVTAYYLKCEVVAREAFAGRAGYLMHVRECISDSVGVELTPVTFRADEALADRERWDLDREILARLSNPPSH